MTKSKKNRIALAVVAVLIALGVTAFGKQVTETISVTYDNIKILIDGIEYIAKDPNGNVVEPFIYNGTTYLPVRGIANAFDINVDWEPQTSTVILGSKNYDWLDEMGYAKYETSGNKNTLTAWPAGTQANGIKYERGLLFNLWYSPPGATESNDGTLLSYQNVEYLLNGNYKTFKGKMVCLEGRQSGIVKVYGDGNLIYNSPVLSSGAQTIDFDLDIENYKILKISASIPNLYSQLGSGQIGIVEARLERK